MYTYNGFNSISQSQSGAWFGSVAISNGAVESSIPFKFQQEPTQEEVELFGQAYVASMNILLAETR